MLPPKRNKMAKDDPPDVNPKKSDPDYKEDVAENKAGMKTKKQTAGTVDNQNTTVKSKHVTTSQVHGAINAFAKKKAQMSAKARKRVAARLKGMKAGAR